MRITASYWRKPIPTNRMDWVASIDDNDGEGPHGFGATKEAAVQDLLDSLDEEPSEPIEIVEYLA
jgi:hypothetical protein